MIKIHLKDAQVHVKEIPGKDGSKFKVYEQRGIVQIGEEVRVVQLRLQNEASAHPAGVYTLGPNSFFVANFGQLQLRRSFDLVPLK